MQVEVLFQRLAPGVEEGDPADFASQVARICPEGDERLPRRVEEEIVEDPGVALRQRVEGMREGEDDMEVLDRQQPRPPGREPALFGQGLALGAVPVPAGVVGDPDRPGRYAAPWARTMSARSTRRAGRAAPTG